MLQRQILKLLPPALNSSQQCRHIWWWGHDTPEDQARRIKAEEDKKMIKWEEPNSELSDIIDKGQNKFYAPARIVAEENAMSNGYSPERFNMIDWFSFTTHPYLARIDNRQFYHQYKRQKGYQKLVDSQRFSRDRLIALGPDLAAAHFLLARGCRVKFTCHPEWTEPFQRYDHSHVPHTYVPGFNLEGIEAQDSQLIYEGFSTLRNLQHLKHLDVSYSPHIDAWCLDRITGEYSDTLQYLDLSGCESLNWNGIESIWRLTRLKTLVLRDLEHIVDLKMLCLLILDVLPDLEIQGVDYLDTTLLEGSEHEHLIRDLFLSETKIRRNEDTKQAEN